jgi:hypothetical protein
MICQMPVRDKTLSAFGRKNARLHGTPIYVWKNGKVVAEKP